MNSKRIKILRASFGAGAWSSDYRHEERSKIQSADVDGTGQVGTNSAYFENTACKSGEGAKGATSLLKLNTCISQKKDTSGASASGIREGKEALKRSCAP